MSDTVRPKPAMTTRNGPRRSEGARQAVLDAADDLLVEVGFAKVTVEGIAQRAGVAKQTIYRWWSSKVDILLDNLIEDGETALAWDVPAGTPAAQAVQEQLTRVVHFLWDEAAGQVMRSLVGHAQHDPVAAERLRTQFLEPQRARDLDALRSTLAELGAPLSPADLEMTLDALMGPLMYNVVVLQTRPTADMLRRTVENALAAAGRSGATS